MVEILPAQTSSTQRCNTHICCVLHECSNSKGTKVCRRNGCELKIITEMWSRSSERERKRVKYWRRSKILCNSIAHTWLLLSAAFNITIFLYPLLVAATEYFPSFFPFWGLVKKKKKEEASNMEHLMSKQCNKNSKHNERVWLNGVCFCLRHVNVIKWKTA